jgi:hypothetical protein
MKRHDSSLCTAESGVDYYYYSHMISVDSASIISTTSPYLPSTIQPPGFWSKVFFKTPRNSSRSSPTHPGLQNIRSREMRGKLRTFASSSDRVDCQIDTVYQHHYTLEVCAFTLPAEHHKSVSSSLKVGDERSEPEPALPMTLIL